MAGADPFCLREALPEVAEIDDASLREAVERVWIRLMEEGCHARVGDIPWYTVTGNTAAAPALAAHIRAVLAAALRLAESARELGGRPERDVLLAGGLLMDADKAVLTDPDGGRTHPAKTWSQHTFYGAHVALAAGVPWPVVHAILSHSKNGLVRPRSLEAVLLHYADYGVCDLRHVIANSDVLFAADPPRWRA